MTINAKILENKKLVYFIINKYYPERRNDEDIIQVGMIGLWKAIELFDESKGYKFSTFATTVIRNAIKQELRSEKTDSRRANLDCNQLFQEEDEEQMYEEVDPTDAMDSQLSIEAYKEKLCKVDKIILQLKEEGETNASIADTVNSSEETVRRAWKRIMREIEEQCM